MLGPHESHEPTWASHRLCGVHGEARGFRSFPASRAALARCGVGGEGGGSIAGMRSIRVDTVFRGIRARLNMRDCCVDFI